MSALGYTFSTYTGFFKYDSASYHPEHLPPVAPNFGLRSDKTWSELLQTIASLNKSSADRSVYKLLFANRHGQGYHNVAEAKYGTADWDAYWSKLNGNGEITWGPDALLTPLGITQAQEVNKGWRAFLAQDDAPPVPTVLYSSPMTRALSTLEAAYDGILSETVSSTSLRPQVKELFREHYGEHTCDQRRSKTAIQKDFPYAEFEESFSEEDLLWTTTRESEEHLDSRIQQALEEVWDSDSGSVLSVTSHSGVMQSLFRVTQHFSVSPATGAIIPLVIKGTPIQ